MASSKGEIVPSNPASMPSTMDIILSDGWPATAPTLLWCEPELDSGAYPFTKESAAPVLSR